MSKRPKASFGAISFLACVLSCSAQSQFEITAVTNSADSQPGLAQKGSLASILTTGLQSTYTALRGSLGAVQNDARPLSNSIADIEVWINFLRAPILAIAFESGHQQINVQVPWEGERDPLYVEVFQGATRAHAEFPSVGVFPPQGWSVFFVNAQGYAIVQHASDYSLVTPQNPARVGEYLTAYGINLGPVSNTPKSGYPSPLSPLAFFDVTAILPGAVCNGGDAILIGGASAAVTYDGLAPGLVGVYQINFQVPQGASGDLALAIRRSISFDPTGSMCRQGLMYSPPDTRTSRTALLPVR